MAFVDFQTSYLIFNSMYLTVFHSFIRAFSLNLLILRKGLYILYIYMYICVYIFICMYWIESPLDCKEIKPVNPKRNHPWILTGRTNAEAEAPILWPHDAKRLVGKDFDPGKDWRQKEKGTAENEMVRQHHWLNGHEFKQTPGDSGGQRSQACCSPWDHKESDITEQLNNNN